MNVFIRAFLLVAVSATSAHAQAVSPDFKSPLTNLYGCADKTDAAERLACFDREVALVKAAEARSDIVALDQPRVAAVRREAFGFPIPSLPKFLLGTKVGQSGGKTDASGTPRLGLAEDADADADSRTFVVTRVGRAGGKVAVYLDNGNVWHLVENEEMNAPRQTPFNVRIRTASMGSFILSVEGRNKGYRVRRVQ